MIDDQKINDYRAEADVSPTSTTETFVALRLAIDNWRWAGVPFYLRTGKALARRYTEVAIKFREAPISMFRGIDLERLRSNYLVLQIAPDEGITLQFNAKAPGPSLVIQRVGMQFRYSDYFDSAPATGYETLALRLHDRRRHAVPARRRRRGRLARGRAIPRGMEGRRRTGPRALSRRLARTARGRRAARTRAQAVADGDMKIKPRRRHCEEQSDEVDFCRLRNDTTKQSIP